MEVNEPLNGQSFYDSGNIEVPLYMYTCYYYSGFQSSVESSFGITLVMHSYAL